MSLGEKLLELRKAKHLSQEEAADKLNVTRQTISKWETDQSTPDFDKIMPICKLYGISTNELLSGEKIESSIDNGINLKKIRRNRAKGISLGILLFFVAISFITVSVAYCGMDPVLSASIFLFIIGIGVFVIVYTCINNKITKKEVNEVDKNKIKVNKQLQSVLSLFFTIIYLFISFFTERWDITWIIWLIYACTLELIKLFMLLKGEEVIEDDEDEE